MKLRWLTTLYSASMTLGFSTLSLFAAHWILPYDQSGEILMLTLVVVLIGLIFGNLSLWLVYRHVASRLAKVVHFVDQEEKELHARIQLTGDDEIAHVAAHVNLLVEQLEVARHQVIAAEERLQFEATHDALTGAWNRNAALELLDRELARGERDGTPVAVILFDVDHFKRINETHGYVAGDLVLQTVASSISRILRSFDVLTRYAGEMFMVVAPQCNTQGATSLAQRILLRVESTFVHVGQEKINVTASAGMAVGKHPLTAEDLIALADIALYRAKENGRNCVAVEEANDEPSSRALFPSQAS